MIQRPFAVLALLSCLPLLGGCLSGKSYPDQYAAALCGSAYACFDVGEIEDLWGYDDEKECREQVAGDVRDGEGYDQWEEGDREFNSENADKCISEAAEVRNDSDCGEEDLNVFTGLQFLADTMDDACGEVYQD